KLSSGNDRARRARFISPARERWVVGSTSTSPGGAKADEPYLYSKYCSLRIQHQATRPDDSGGSTRTPLGVFPGHRAQSENKNSGNWRRGGSSASPHCAFAHDEPRQGDLRSESEFLEVAE